MIKGAGKSKGIRFSVAQASYLLVSVLLIVPLINPVDLLSVKISADAQVIYNYLERVLPAETPVLIDLHYGSLARTGLEPQLAIVVKHLFEKECKILFVSTSPSGTGMFNQFKSTSPGIFLNKRYGIDYVYLGNISGGEAAVAALARSIRETVGKDFYGISVTNYIELPIMSMVDKAEDFALAFILSIETEVFDWYARHWASRNVHLLFGTLSPTASSAGIHVKEGKAIGVIAGQKTTADYEILVGKAGQGFAAVKNRNFGCMLTIAFMFFGNMALLYWKSKHKAVNGGLQHVEACSTQRFCIINITQFSR
ncbi:MAG: hypothetical protein QW510_04340 [Candidatus Bathyarchaeia archaeon]